MVNYEKYSMANLKIFHGKLLKPTPLIVVTIYTRRDPVVNYFFLKSIEKTQIAGIDPNVVKM